MSKSTTSKNMIVTVITVLFCLGTLERRRQLRVIMLESDMEFSGTDRKLYIMKKGQRK